MIQRIQTLYLFLAGILPVITFFTPLVTLKKEGSYADMFTYGYDSSQVTELAGRHPYGVAVFTAISAIWAFVTIFGYKNRRSQLLNVRLCMGSNALWYATLGCYVYSLTGNIGLSYTPTIWIILPLVSILFAFLAGKAIRKDEALVRAADRIR